MPLALRSAMLALALALAAALPGCSTVETIRSAEEGKHLSMPTVRVPLFNVGLSDRRVPEHDDYIRRLMPPPEQQIYADPPPP